VPKISARSFTSGSAMLVVRGAVQIEQEIPLNGVASFGTAKT
jgi:hypothetical protein